MEYEEIVQQIIEFLGTFAFAISGIRHAAAKHFDWFGGYVCGIAVAIGGGTIRDVMLGTTPFWMTLYHLYSSGACFRDYFCQTHGRPQKYVVCVRYAGLSTFYDCRNSKIARFRTTVLGSDYYGLYNRFCRRRNS